MDNKTVHCIIMAVVFFVERCLLREREEKKRLGPRLFWLQALCEQQGEFADET